jgi:uncharacterized membrane protein YbhN (UPF0104 family)
MLGLTSAITVVPGAERTMGIIMLVLLSLSLSSAIAALLLHRKFKRKPDSPLFQSKIVSRTCITIAVILTLICLMSVVG